MMKDRLCKWAAQNRDRWSWVYCWEVCGGIRAWRQLSGTKIYTAWPPLRG